MALFCRNVGGMDRAARLIAGVVLLPAGLLLVGPFSGLGIGIAVIGFLALFTGLTRFCILYVPFGISTIRSAQPSLAGAAPRR